MGLFKSQGGGETSQNQNQTTSTHFAPYYENFLNNDQGTGMFNALNGLLGNFSQNQSMLQGGGTAPTNGVFNGGGSPIQSVSPQFPSGGQMPSGVPVSNNSLPIRLLGGNIK